LPKSGLETLKKLADYLAEAEKNMRASEDAAEQLEMSLEHQKDRLSSIIDFIRYGWIPPTSEQDKSAFPCLMYLVRVDERFREDVSVVTRREV
jgi:hypothetical protein